MLSIFEIPLTLIYVEWTLLTLSSLLFSFYGQQGILFMVKNKEKFNLLQLSNRQKIFLPFNLKTHMAILI